MLLRVPAYPPSVLHLLGPAYPRSVLRTQYSTISAVRIACIRQHHSLHQYGTTRSTVADVSTAHRTVQQPTAVLHTA
eukprot:2884082-Rhodomonas_salina.5